MSKSFLGKDWNFSNHDKSKLELIKQETGLSDITAKILVNRGIDDPEEIAAFLKSKLKNTIPEPYLLLDMEKGIDRLVLAIQSKEKIMVFGDYDVDGITSTYLVVKYLRLIGINADYKIPSRVADGYGLSLQIINNAAANGVHLMIVVDSGIESIDEVKIAKSLGIDVIIIDHHTQTKSEIPGAVAVINPNRTDQCEIANSYIKHLCAAGVVFIFIMALQRALKKIGFFDGEQMQAFDLREFIDSVALGTLCDAVKLVGINRAVVRYCVSAGISSRGISALMNAFNIQKIDSPDDFSFYVGPAMNAAGRVGDPSVALDLLLEDDPDKAREISEKLIAFNSKRKEIEKLALADALAMISDKKLDQKNGICVFGDGWHEGVIGIISGRIRDKFNKPAFVISFRQDGIGKGSSRSIDGLHIGRFFDKAAAQNIIIGGGGHALAGGFSIHKNKINEFLDFIDKNAIGYNVTSGLDIDYSISACSNLHDIKKELSIIEPFGMGVENPVFAVKRVRLRHFRETKSGAHVVMTFSGEAGDSQIKAIIFGVAGKKEFMRSIEENKDSLLDIAGKISVSKSWDSFIIEDARLSV
jgi:single-stranded-DNA-specific exonuclease